MQLPKLVFFVFFLAAQASFAQNNGPQASFKVTDSRCPGIGAGAIRVTYQGGKLPVTFEWSKQGTDLKGESQLDEQDVFVDLPNLYAGTYNFTFTDGAGLKKSENVVVEEPPTLRADLAIDGDKCMGQNKGYIELQNIRGGTGPYLVSFEKGKPGLQTKWQNLKPGQYFLDILDSKGCKKEEGVVLPTGVEFSLDLGPDTVIYSGDTLRFMPSADQLLDSIRWTPARYATSERGGMTKLFPFRTATYTAYAVDKNGCGATDSKTVRVLIGRDVYAPNVFQPAATDPANAVFTLFGSGGVQSVRLMRVYDRVGRVWFESRNFRINDTTAGWDGSLAGIPAPTGVYLWQAVLQYTSGKEEVLTGDVTLLR
jgi:CHU_C Type IX secretion signal domain